MKPIARSALSKPWRNIESAPPVSPKVDDHGDLNAASGIIRAVLLGGIAWTVLLVLLVIS